MNSQAGEERDILTRSTEVLSTISAFWALTLAGIILWDILGRELFDSPFLGTHEIVGNSIVGILFLELASTIKRGAMLRTLLIYNNIGVTGRRWIDCISYIFGISLFATILVGGYETTITSWQTLEIEGAGAFEIPIYPVRTLILVFSALCILVYLQLLFHIATGKITPERG